MTDDLPMQISSFVQGYGVARGGVIEKVLRVPSGLAVTYGPGSMLRRHERFVWQPLQDADLSALNAGEWVTIVGDPEVLLPGGMEVFDHLADEVFMVADLAGRDWDGTEVDALLVHTDPDVEAVDLGSDLGSFTPAPGAFLFAVKEFGRFVATARYGIGNARDIVVDRVGTIETHRRLGFARRLMIAIMAHAAAQGGSRAILFSTMMGLPLYAGLGFAPVSPATVYVRK